MRFDIITLFPDLFQGFLSESILAKTIASGQISVHLHDPRTYSVNKHGRVDDKPYGGGPGMVLCPQPWIDCVEAVQKLEESPGRVIVMTPAGRPFKQKVAQELSELDRIILLCGRYEGFDQRIFDILQPDEISIGDYVINGGEVASMVVIEATMRLLPGALGDDQSAKEDSFSENDLKLEFPQYTRPADFRGHKVPEVLLSGNHGAIAQWREQQSETRTNDRRSDLSNNRRSKED